MRTLFLSLALLPFMAAAQDQFPTMSGETADGEQIDLPPKGPRKYMLVGMAFGQKAQPMLEEWYEPAYLRFVAKHGLFAGATDVQVHFVPLFVGVNKAAYEPSLRKFRKSASPEVVDLVVFIKADAEALRDDLNMTDKDIPYIFIVDQRGRIVHRTQGAFSEEKLEALEEVLLR
mgnify:CR=1 FL=1